MSGRALGLTLLALALSGSAILAGTRGVAAGQMPLGGAGTRDGTPVATTPVATPAPTPRPAATSPGHASAAAEPSTRQPALNPVTSTTSAPAPAAAPGEPNHLDGVRVPPVEAMSPVTGLNFKSGLELGPVLLVADLFGLAALALLLRRRWLRPAD